MTVSEISELRKLLRSADVEFKVVKNTLARIASQSTSVAVAKDYFKGPMGIAITRNEPLLAAKKVLEYAKKNEKLKISSGIIEGKLCVLDEIKTIAELPPRQVLLSVLSGVMQAPLRKLAGAISATVSSFVYALNALKAKRKA